jgi:nitrite reductase/ring-hydroxylating ferredoxin subunit
MKHETGIDACAGCAAAEAMGAPASEGSPTRRDFVRDASAIVATVLLGLGADPAKARALPVRLTTGSAVQPGTLSFALPSTDGVMIDKKNEIILVRWQDSVFAFALSCPHQRTMLRWLEREQRFQCPKHKSKYRPDGAFISGRATRGMDRYAIRLKDGMVIVDRTTIIREDENAASWSGAMISID